MNFLFASLLLAAGFACVVAEVFFPSLGMLSILAVLSLVGSVALAFREGTTLGLVFLGVAVGGGIGSAIFAFMLFPRTPWGRRLIVTGPSFAEDPAATDPRHAGLEGRSGRTVTMLRPSGIAEIEGRRVDCVADGELIEADVPITVVRMDGNRVVVARATAPNRPTSP
jgi:membrane-bound serine protease (ClpP class)